MATEELTNAELTEVIETLCESKAEEFRLLGYENVTSDEIWDCLGHKYDKQGMPKLHELVSDILSMRVNQFMNYVTMSSYKSAPDTWNQAPLDQS